MTLPTGGTLTYAYTGSNNGITCADGSAAGLTRTTPDGTWTYSRSSSQTTITDPASNATSISFQGIYETERVISSNGHTIEQLDTCYNGATAPCTGTAVSLPVTQLKQYVTLPGSATNLVSETNSTYNAYGLPVETDNYDYAPNQTGKFKAGGLLNKSIITYNTALTNGIVDHPSSVVLYDTTGTNKIGQTNYSYDETAVTATSGTPQHITVTGSRGNLTSVTSYTNSSSSLKQTTAYFDTGNVSQTEDANQQSKQVTSYTYGTCGNAFPTSISTYVNASLSLNTSETWNCTGAVVTAMTDANGQKTSTVYNDAYFWRPTQITDPTGAVTNIAYTDTANQVESSLTFNSGSSTVDTLRTMDGLGRARFVQTKQGPASSNYDTVETDYNSVGQFAKVTLPYTAPQASATQGNSSQPGTTTSYDALGRPLVVTDGGNGSINYAYLQNDTYFVVEPAPNGENPKSRQLEYDALGRLTSVCELTGQTGAGPCGQNTSRTGYWTKYTYGGTSLTVTQNAQGTPQTRIVNYDWLGRTLTETNPENGTVTYTYDTDSTCGTSKGDLVKRVDAMSNVACYGYDAVHRNTSITYPSGQYASVTPAKTFVFDAATVNGAAMANAKGRLAEAYTTSSGSRKTDLGFSYSSRGERTDVYESTPDSGGYYHSSLSFWENGLPKQRTPGITGMPTLNYTPDGEGRIGQIVASSGFVNPAAAVNYSAFGVAGITYGSGDSDSFGYDANTGRQTNYTFNVNGRSVTGNLSWNANGTLHQLAIVDQFLSQNTQTCVNQYDDLTRLISNNCGSALWNQSFSYDAFGNITKSASKGTSFQVTYNNNNQFATVPVGSPSYDANGNVLKDGVHPYTWDADGNLVQNDYQVGGIYDALGRMVEQQLSGSSREIVYGPDGQKLAYMTGQTLIQGFEHMPKGAIASYFPNSANNYFAHPDWLGTQRLSSTQTGRAVTGDTAFAPFGEQYVQQIGGFFTGVADNPAGQDIWAFPARNLEATEGRWIRPDPAGFSAVDFTNPQTLNRYAYVLGNPLNSVDPTVFAAALSPASAQAPIPAAEPRCCKRQSKWGSILPFRMRETPRQPTFHES